MAQLRAQERAGRADPYAAQVRRRISAFAREADAREQPDDAAFRAQVRSFWELPAMHRLFQSWVAFARPPQPTAKQRD